VDDAAITDLSGESVIRTEGPLGGPEDVVRLYVVRRGAWTLGSLDDPGEKHYGRTPTEYSRSTPG
jgi:hypothetical protein